MPFCLGVTARLPIRLRDHEDPRLGLPCPEARAASCDTTHTEHGDSWDSVPRAGPSPSRENTIF